METTVERLVDKIYQEGVAKAEQQAAAILAEAKQEATLLKDQADREAALIIETARKEAQRLKQNTEAELSLAASAALGRLRQSVTGLIREAVLVKPVQQLSQDENFLKTVILKLLEGRQGDYTLVVPENLRGQLEEYFRQQVAVTLPGLTVKGGHIGGGFTLEKKGDGYAFDFSDEALIAFFEDFLKPATAALFKQ